MPEEYLIERLNESIESCRFGDAEVIQSIIDDLEEIDTLPPKETDLILAAEKYASKYDGDDRQDIKTDVLNAFYHGSEWSNKNK